MQLPRGMQLSYCAIFEKLTDFGCSQHSIKCAEIEICKKKIYEEKAGSFLFP
jgi:hypothetical protein